MAHSTIEWKGSRHCEEIEFGGMAAPEQKSYSQAEVEEVLHGDNWVEKQEAEEAKARGYILDLAKKTINGERQDQYGNPEDNFTVIAQLWTAYLQYPVTAHDVAMLQTLLKVARIRSGSGKEDSYTDLAGYTALAADIMAKNKARQAKKVA